MHAFNSGTCQYENLPLTVEIVNVNLIGLFNLGQVCDLLAENPTVYGWSVTEEIAHGCPTMSAL